MDPAKLKVIELRAELSQRGLDTKGVKAVLVDRLRKALEEGNEAVEESSEESSEASPPAEDRERTPEPVRAMPARTPGRTRSVRGTPAKPPAKATTPQKQTPVKSSVQKPTSPVINKTTEATILEEDEPQSGAVPQVSSEESEPPKAACTPQVAEEAPELSQVEPESAPKSKPSEPKVSEPEKHQKPEKELETPQELKTVQNVESPQKSESPQKCESPKKPETPQKNENLQKPETPKKPETAQIIVTPQKAETPKKPESPQKVVTPLKPESPQKITTPQKSETPQKVTSPQKAETPQKVTSPQKPETPQKVTTPQKPETSQKVTTPQKAITPQKPEITQKIASPQKAGTPQKLEVTQKPGTPQKPETPQKAATPQKPETPQKVTTPQKPEASKKPESPQKTGGTPGKPEPTQFATSPVKRADQSQIEVSPSRPDTTPNAKGAIEKQQPAVDVEEKMEVDEPECQPKQEPGDDKLTTSEGKLNESVKVELEDSRMQKVEENCKLESEVEGKADVKPNIEKVKKEDEDAKSRGDRKRKRSTSSERQISIPAPVKKDDEPEIDCSRVLLSWYDSDLNLVIDRSEFLTAAPMHNDGFGYVWAGARASFGFTSGKVFYEVKIINECSVNLQDEEYPHVLRAGWSVVHTSMQLGEEKLSYGYGGTGKISTGNNFRDYGPRFGPNDVLGCYLDMSGDEVIMSYTLNGKNLGTAFRVLKTELDGKALYPHILTKNCEFACNFGDEKPWGGMVENFIPVGQVNIKDRTAGPVRPEKREDCEMLMMCGLPGSGKTFWAGKYAREHAEKMYNILGTNSLIDKMKVIGLPRKRNYHGRWDVLIDKCTRCLNKLLDIASSRRRNYILDQTNVYPSAQRRKMRNFFGFQRRAIVVVPNEDEFQLRTAKRIAVEGKEVPDSAIMEMKANFGAPVMGDLFDAVEWVELGEEEARKLIAGYNKEGKDAGYAQQQPNKRPKLDKNEGQKDNQAKANRDGRNPRMAPFAGRARNAPWRGGPQMPGGWRDRAPRGAMRGAPYGAPRAWRGRGGPPPPPRMHRPGERRGPSNDRRPGPADRRPPGPPRPWGPTNSNYTSGSSPWAGHQGSWGGAQASGNWSGGQGGWGGQAANWANWKDYGSNSSYNQSGYGQQGYGNGSWAGWSQQYYNQDWSQQQQTGGQSSTTSGQSSTTGANSTTAASTTSTGSSYNNFSQGWQGYPQSYNYSTDGSNTSIQQQK